MNQNNPQGEEVITMKKYIILIILFLLVSCGNGEWTYYNLTRGNPLEPFQVDAYRRSSGMIRTGHEHYIFTNTIVAYDVLFINEIVLIHYNGDSNIKIRIPVSSIQEIHVKEQ